MVRAGGVPALGFQGLGLKQASVVYQGAPPPPCFAVPPGATAFEGRSGIGSVDALLRRSPCPS